MNGEPIYRSLTAQTRSVWGMLANGVSNLTHAVALYGLLACFPALILVIVADLLCYAAVFSANRIKVRTIREQAQNGVTQIEAEHTPFRFFVYALDIEDKAEKYNRRFCEYYGLPEDIRISYK